MPGAAAAVGPPPQGGVDVAAPGPGARQPPGAGPQPPKPVEPIICGQCGQPNDPSRKFCSNLECNYELVHGFTARNVGEGGAKLSPIAWGLIALAVLLVLALLIWFFFLRSGGDTPAPVDPGTATPTAPVTTPPTAPATPVPPPTEVAACTTETVTTLPREAITARASSVLPVAGDLTYFPENTIDGDPDTAWNAADERVAGEFIVWEFSERRLLSAVELVNGYTKSDLVFTGNHRIQEAILTTESFRGTITLADSRDPQRFEAPGPTNFVSLEVVSVYEGNRDDFREVALTAASFEVAECGENPLPELPAAPNAAPGAAPAAPVTPTSPAATAAPAPTATAAEPTPTPAAT